MSNAEQPKRIRDRNQLIQSGYQGTAQPGSNALAGAQPELTQSDILRLEKQVSTISANLAPYSTFLPELQYALSPDGYVNLDMISFPPTGGGTGTVFVQGTVTAYSAGTGTATVGAGSVSFTNTTGLGIFVGDVVLLGLQSGVYYLIGIISRPSGYTPPSYIAPSYTGFPLDGRVLGAGIKTSTGISPSVNLRTFVDFDSAGALGLGTNCYVGFNHIDTAYKVLAHSITTSITSDLGWPAGFAPGRETPPHLLIVGDSIVMKVSNVGSNLIYVWRQSTGWVTATVPGATGTGNAFSSITVSGTYYVVVTRSASWYYYNVVAGTWSGAIALPSGAGRIAAKGAYMWTDNGYVATASLSPSWTLRHSGLGATSPIDTFRADVADTGELVVATQFTGPPTTWGITTYSFTAATSTTKAQMFTTTGLAADGEPTALWRVSAGTGYISVAGTVRADVIDPSLGTLEAGGAVWVTDGITTAIRSSQVQFASYGSGTDYQFSGTYIHGSVVASQVGMWQVGSSNVRESTLDVKTF